MNVFTSIDGDEAVYKIRLKFNSSAEHFEDKLYGSVVRSGFRKFSSIIAVIAVLNSAQSFAASSKLTCDSVVPTTNSSVDLSQELTDPVGILENFLNIKQAGRSHSFQNQVVRFEKSEADGLRNFLNQPTQYAYRDAVSVERPYISEVDGYLRVKSEILKMLTITKQKYSDRKGEIKDQVDLLEMKVKPTMMMMQALIFSRQSAIDPTYDHASYVSKTSSLSKRDLFSLSRAEAGDLQYLALSQHVQNEIATKDAIEADVLLLSSIQRRTPDQSARLNTLKKQLSQRNSDLVIRLTILDQAHRVYFDDSIRDIAGEVKTVGLCLGVGYQLTRELTHPDPRMSPLAKKLPQQTVMDYLLSEILVRAPLKTQAQKRELH